MATLAAVSRGSWVFFSLPLGRRIYASLVWRRVRGDDGATLQRSS